MTCEVDFFKAGLDQSHMQVMQGLNQLQIFSKQFTWRFKTASGHACSSGSGRKRIVEGGPQQVSCEVTTIRLRQNLARFRQELQAH